MTSFFSLQVSLQQPLSTNAGKNLAESLQETCDRIMNTSSSPGGGASAGAGAGGVATELVENPAAHHQTENEHQQLQEGDEEEEPSTYALQVTAAIGAQALRRPPRGFAVFHRVGPLGAPTTVHSSTCTVPVCYSNNDDNNNNNNNETTTTLHLRIELIEICGNRETIVNEENPIIVTREFSSAACVPSSCSSVDLLPVDIKLGAGEQQADDGDGGGGGGIECLLFLKLRNVSSIFAAPLAYVSDPGPPRLRFIGNMPEQRQARRALQRLYGFTHVSAAAYHALQYILQITNTPNESGNIVFGPKRLQTLDLAVSRGWGGTAPLFRFSMLRHLDVSNTFFGDVGFTVVLSVVSICQRVEALNMSRCGITGRSVPLVVQTLLRHDGIEELDISDNDLMETSGEDLLRLPRNNCRIVEVRAGGSNAFSNYVMRRLERYCRENLETFNADPLNPFGASCAYLRESRDVSPDMWGSVAEMWLALTALPAPSAVQISSTRIGGRSANGGGVGGGGAAVSATTTVTSPPQPPQFNSLLKNQNDENNENNNNSSSDEFDVDQIDGEAQFINQHYGVAEAGQEEQQQQQTTTTQLNNADQDFLIPPTATAPLLSQVWWRAFEQLVGKIDDPMVLMCFAPLAKPVVVKHGDDGASAVTRRRRRKKRRNNKTNNNNNNNQEQNQQQAEEDEGGQQEETGRPQLNPSQQMQNDDFQVDEENDEEEDEEEEEEEEGLLKIPDAAESREQDQLNETLRYKARQQFQTTLLRAFIVALPFSSDETSWYHVSGTLEGIGESLRAAGVTMVDLRRFHLALINALKHELGGSFDIAKQSAWVAAASLVLRKLMIS